MLKKLGFFVFALALGSSYAIAADDDCTAVCYDAYYSCMDSGYPKPPVCARELKRCLSYCNVQ